MALDFRSLKLIIFSFDDFDFLVVLLFQTAYGLFPVSFWQMLVVV